MSSSSSPAGGMSWVTPKKATKPQNSLKSKERRPTFSLNLPPRSNTIPAKRRRQSNQMPNAKKHKSSKFIIRTPEKTDGSGCDSDTTVCGSESDGESSDVIRTPQKSAGSADESPGVTIDDKLYRELITELGRVRTNYQKLDKYEESDPSAHKSKREKRLTRVQRDLKRRYSDTPVK